MRCPSSTAIYFAILWWFLGCEKNKSNILYRCGTWIAIVELRHTRSRGSGNDNLWHVVLFACPPFLFPPPPEIVCFPLKKQQCTLRTCARNKNGNDVGRLYTYILYSHHRPGSVDRWRQRHPGAIVACAIKDQI